MVLILHRAGKAKWRQSLKLDVENKEVLNRFSYPCMYIAALKQDDEGFFQCWCQFMRGIRVPLWLLV